MTDAIRWTGEGAPCDLYHRPGSIDSDTLQACLVNDEYRLKAAGIVGGDVVVDCGAYIGGFSVLASSLGATVYAVEASVENCRMVSKNTATLRPVVNVIPAALAARTGRTEVSYSEGPYRFMGATIVTASTVREQADSVSLNDILHVLDRVAFMKMDIEGAEYEVLGACGRDNLDKIQQIAIEIHGRNELPWGDCLADIQRYLVGMHLRDTNNGVAWFSR